MIKKLIFLDYSFFGGGRGSYDLNLIKKLSKFEFEIITISSIDDKFKHNKYNIENNVKYIYLKNNIYHFVKYCLYLLLHYLRKEKYIVFCPSRRLIPIFSPIIKICKSKIIFFLQGAPLKELSVMDDFKLIRNNKINYILNIIIIKISLIISSIMSNKIIVISNEILSELNRLRIPNNKINVIYYGIDTELFTFSDLKREIIRKKYKINENDICISYVGRISSKSPTKLNTIFTLLHIIKKLKNKSIKLLIIGEGNYLNYLKKYVKKINLKNIVQFIGYVENKKIPDYLSASDFFWFYTKEPLPTYGLALLEAMSCENITIANKYGAFKEIIHNNINGILMPLGFNKMLYTLKKVINNKENWNNIKKEARKTIVTNYSDKIILNHIISLIHDV